MKGSLKAIAFFGLIRACFGKTPSAAHVREISACLQQGRLFYEAAEQSPLEIRPLQLFYGMVGFAKALVIAKRLLPLTTLKHSHGLTDVSAPNSRIADLRVRIGNAGTFQEFNDVVKDLNRLIYFDNLSMPKKLYLSSAASEALVGVDISLREILSRIPGLMSLFQQTFGEEAKAWEVWFHFISEKDGRWGLRIDDPDLFTDCESLGRIVSKWAARFPFLKNWSLLSAQPAWGYSVLEFENTLSTGADRLSEDCFSNDEKNYKAKTLPTAEGKIAYSPFTQELPPLAGGYTGSMTVIMPINNVYLSEFSLHFLALFVLSSLVRYRPEVWSHAISRTSVTGAPADDKALALIENFLGINSTVIPPLVVAILNPNEDRYK